MLGNCAMRSTKKWDQGRSTHLSFRPGFSLLELVIVVVIIGIVAAIAVPRLSRSATGAADAVLRSDLAVLRKAIDLYAIEHGGKFPDPKNVTAKLTLYTNFVGHHFGLMTKEHIYGPYLRSIPPVPVGPNRGQTGIAIEPKEGVGWIYDPMVGQIRANSGTAMDDRNILYSDY